MTPPHVDKLIIGCGYLGRRVAAEWLRRGCTVAALTRSESYAAGFERAGIRPVIGDVTRPASLAALPPCATLLYAVGFDRGAGRSQREVYVEGLENVLNLQATRTLDASGSLADAAPVSRLLYVSSTSVYAQSAGEWIDETSPTAPDRPNGRVCLEAEQLVRRRVPDAIVLRLAGLYGPGRLLRRLDQLHSGEPIGGHPDAWLNLIHVDDAVAAVLAADECGRPGATYLVCDDHPLRRREYFRLLAQLTAAPPPAFAEPAGDAEPRTPGLNKRCSNRRLREELGVHLRYPTVAEGLPAALTNPTA